MGQHIRVIQILSIIVGWLMLSGVTYPIKHPIITMVAIGLTWFLTDYLTISGAQGKLKSNAIIYMFWLIKEIYKSAFTVIKIIWQQNPKISPELRWIDSRQQTEIGNILYCNSITLTPGTIAVDLKNDKILVHALDSTAIDDLQEDIMSKRIRNIIC